MVANLAPIDRRSRLPRLVCISNMDIIALLLKLLASAAVSSAATPPACPSTTKLKASAAEVNNAVWDFATIFYYQKDIAGAFNKYVASDYIQHNPDFPDGRHTIIDGLASTWANSGTWFTVSCFRSQSSWPMTCI